MQTLPKRYVAPDCGTFTMNYGDSGLLVTNQTLVVQATGRPLRIKFNPEKGGACGFNGTPPASACLYQAYAELYRNGVPTGQSFQILLLGVYDGAVAPFCLITQTVNGWEVFDTPAPGEVTYTIVARFPFAVPTGGSPSIYIFKYQLIIEEA